MTLFKYVVRSCRAAIVERYLCKHSSKVIARGIKLLFFLEFEHLLVFGFSPCAYFYGLSTTRPKRQRDIPLPSSMNKPQLMKLNVMRRDNPFSVSNVFIKR